MKLNFRILPPQYESDGQFQRLLGLLNAHRSIIHEISLFTEYWHHSYFPLDQFARQADLLKKRLHHLREEGFPSVGVNMLDTTGHLDEAWSFLEPLPFQALIGHDGAVSRSCACSNSAEFQVYIAEKYRLLALAQPDFIWVDDDIRLKHKGAVGYGCFCPGCLQLFGRESGREVPDRASLVGQLNWPENTALRVEWVEFNGRTLERLLRHVRESVHAVDSRIELGLMTAAKSGEGGLWSYSGSTFARWMDCLQGNRIRPGGGFYDDDAPRNMVTKALAIAEQCQDLPAAVDQVQYELENFPYQKLGKSVRSVLNECTLALGAGCNGIACNLLKDLPGGLDDYAPLLAAINAESLLWKNLVAECGGLPMAGLWQATRSDLMSLRPVSESDWFRYDADFEPSRANILAQIGLPLTLDRRHSCATLLTGRMPEIFRDDELSDMLSGGLLLDACALQALWKRGFGELTGVKPGATYDNGVTERFTEHRLNGGFAGDARDARISFWNSPAQELIPIANTVESQAELVGYDQSLRGACLTTYENTLGGRIAVLGYAPWSHLGSSAKRWQILELADWVSRGHLPIRMDPCLRVTPLVRRSADGTRCVIVLLNTAYDDTGPFKIRIRSKLRSVSLLAQTGREILPLTSYPNESTIHLAGIPAWHTAVLVGAP